MHREETIHYFRIQWLLPRFLMESDTPLDILDDTLGFYYIEYHTSNENEYKIHATILPSCGYGPGRLLATGPLRPQLSPRGLLLLPFPHRAFNCDNLADLRFPTSRGIFRPRG